MSRGSLKSLTAFAMLMPLSVFAPSDASAFGHGGFGGIGFGFGAAQYGGVPSAGPYDGYGGGGVWYIERPHRHASAHGSKNRDAKDNEAKPHRGWRNVTAREKEPAPPRAASSAPPSTAGTAPPAAPCLSKEYRADHSVVFKDTCTNESAAATAPPPATTPPPAAAALAPPRQSIEIEPLPARAGTP